MSEKFYAEKKFYSTNVVGGQLTINETSEPHIFDYHIHNPAAKADEVEHYYGSVEVDEAVEAFLSVVSKLDISELCLFLDIEPTEEE